MIALDRAERHDFLLRFSLFILLFFFLLFLVWKRKGGYNNRSRDQKSCLSSRSIAIELVSFFRSTQESKVWVSNPNMDSIKCFKSWLFSYFPIRVLIPFHFVGAGCGKERNQCPHRNWKSYWLTSRKIVSFSVNESIKDIKNQLTKID